MEKASKVSGGTQTLVVATEHFFPSSDGDVTGGSFLFVFDLTNMAAGDTVELRAYRKVLEGSNWVSIDIDNNDTVRAYVNAQTVDGKESPPLLAGYAIRFSLKQTAGVGFDVEQSVWKLAP